MFHVGQLVLCVDDTPSRKYVPPGYGVRGGLDGLKHGKVYRIREANVTAWCGVAGCVRLDEIYRADPVLPDEPYHPARFRPLSNSRLAVFRKLLAPLPTPSKERAET